MKKILLSVFILFGAVSAFSQVNFGNDTINSSGAASDFEIVSYNLVTNTSTDTAFRWRRLKNTFSSASWTSAVCDNNLCHGETTDSADFVMQPGERFDMSAHFYPDGQEGCASALIEIVSLQNPENRAVARFQADSDNSNSCLDVLGVRKVSPKELVIAPNPASDYLTVKFNNRVNYSIEIYDLIGNKVLSKSAESIETSIDIQNLPKGIYIIKGITTDGLTIAKTFRKTS